MSSKRGPHDVVAESGEAKMESLVAEGGGDSLPGPLNLTRKTDRNACRTVVIDFSHEGNSIPCYGSISRLDSANHLKSKEKGSEFCFGIPFAELAGQILRDLFWDRAKITGRRTPQKMKLRLIMNKGEDAFSYNIEGRVISLGRSNANDIQIHDKRVSRHHLVVWTERRRYFLKDLGSENGTYVNGYRVPSGATVEVKEGFAISIGWSVFCLGEGSSGDLFAFLDLLDPRKRRGRDTTTVIVEEDSAMAA